MINREKIKASMRGEFSMSGDDNNRKIGTEKQALFNGSRLVTRGALNLEPCPYH